MSALTIADCPVGCGSLLPTVNFSECTPQTSFGEIEKIYIAAGDASIFTDWNTLSEWTDALLAGTLVELTVLADLPAATADEVVISLGRKVYSPATHTINVDIDDLSAENYEFARMTSCNVAYKIWFATPSFQYGGNDGIVAMVNLRPVIERGQKSLNKLSGTITWEAQFSAERAINVFA